MDDTALQSLVADDTSGQALAYVLARAEASDGTVTYDAVSDAVAPETWGRLLKTGALVPIHDAFVVDDPPTVRAALAEVGIEETTNLEQDITETDSSAWSTADKLAGVGALGLMAGYRIPTIKSAIVGPMDLVLGPVAGILPFPLLIVVLATVTALVSTGVRRQLLDEDRMNAHKERMQQVRDQLAAAKQRDDGAAVDRLTDRQQELMRNQLGMFKQMFRPIVWTMLVTIPVFLWLSWFVVDPSGAIVSVAPIVPMVDRIIWSAHLVGPMQVWMVWYFVSSFTSNLLVKRATNRLFDCQRQSVAQ
ncbi:DUF106 domain-containing protein [Halocatena pleomorpha]|uniref:DUF106 domain-containing protein n=1 Tax=Halocatena pleomorpha TaxID=1785090 RepID=A0A3P3RL10_9EURY|nr:EMC3/TMCO1 family protein [Halocatena pleomorpha]RRJ34226.1 DUF106 domain-containing protein [Halocatena pleomorpha]